VSKNIFLLL